MRYLITGARGFIGAAAVRAAVSAGHSVAVVVRPGGLPGRLKPVVDDVTWIHADLSALDAPATAAIAAFAPDVMVHAGWEGVGSAERNAMWQVSRNVPAALAWLTLAANVGARHFIGLGSQAEYGACSGRITEDQPLNPTTLYGAAKAAANSVTRCAARLVDVKHSWLRVFSTYGAGSDANWVLPMTANAMAQGMSPKLTQCEQRWEFLHVRDAAEAILAVADSGACGTFNLGSGNVQSLRDVILALRDRVDATIQPQFGAVSYRPDQVMHLEADITKLRTATGWSPRISIETGLDEIAHEALAQNRITANV